MRERRAPLKALERLETPDLWPDIRVREPRRAAPGPPSGRRWLAAAVAFMVAAAGLVFAIRVFRAGERPKPASDPLAAIPVGWTELPPPPEVTQGSAILWTGTELLSWGGYRESDDTDVADGYAFDPSTQRWSSLPQAPSGRTGAQAVWTGSEAIFWGGWDRDRSYPDGFAFEPATRRWRTIAPGPIESADGTVVVWTGTEMIVWGGGKPGEPSNRAGAAYDPSSDTWRRIADAPIRLNAASAVWTGTEVIVFGSLLDSRNVAATPTSVGAAYDPARDTWRELPPSDLSPQAIAAVWLGGRLIAYDYNWKAEAYEPSADAWRPLPNLPFHSGECYPGGVVVANQVFAFGCGEAATWKVGEDAWRAVDGGITDATIEANGTAYKLWRFATLVPAGDVLFLSAEGITVNRKGVPCYGCQGSPTSLWAYRPEGTSGPSPSETPAEGTPAGTLLMAVGSGSAIFALAYGAPQMLGDDVVPFGFSSDGTKVLAGTLKHEPSGLGYVDELFSLDLATGGRSVVFRLASPASIEDAEWSPDGSELAYTYAPDRFENASLYAQDKVPVLTLCLMDIATYATACFPDVGTVFSFDWSPDGSKLVLGKPGGLLGKPGANNAMEVLDVATGVASVVVSADDPAVLAALRQAGWSSDVSGVQFLEPSWSSSAEYVGAMVSTVPMVFTAGGELVVTGHPALGANDFSWSPTDDVMAYAVGPTGEDFHPSRLRPGTPAVYALDPASGKDTMILSTEGLSSAEIDDVVWSPGGRFLALGNRELIRIVDTTGDMPIQETHPYEGSGGALLGWEA